MSEQTEVGTTVYLPMDVHQALRDLARKNKRSLKSHLEWILTRHAEAKKDDSA